MMSRHKRNHINGSKQQHHHSGSYSSPPRHDVLSFRNSDTFEHSLHPHDRLNNQRHRRDLSKCLGTHKQKRRLSIGCARDDIVEVHPQCSEAGDEGTEIWFLLLLLLSKRKLWRKSCERSFRIPFSFPLPQFSYLLLHYGTNSSFLFLG
jgi:hypothetical protein